VVKMMRRQRLIGITVLVWLGLSVPLLVYAFLGAQSERPVPTPSNVAWTDETIELASGGDPVRGLLLARRCERCHGTEGFSSKPEIPNLAGMDKLAFWKQLQDFQAEKRESATMQMIMQPFTPRDDADLAAYYSMLPTMPDPQDPRAFPGDTPPAAHGTMAARLISLGDGRRGVPPCQACHGPVAYVRGAPPLLTQNSAYILKQLTTFATGIRTNDINMPMRSIAADLTEEERKALAEYYGAGLASLPTGATAPRR
jgi:cytochrome c553